MIGEISIYSRSNGLNKQDEASSTASPSSSSMPTAPTLVRTLSDASSFVTQDFPSKINRAIKTETIPCTISTTKTKLITLLEAAGGTDKDPTTGHRRDTIPIIEAIVERGIQAQVLQFREENSTATDNESEQVVTRRNEQARAHNDALRSALIGVHGRGASQGIIVMPHPEVVRRMGAKDALCKIRHLRCGLEDTDVYYEAQAFMNGFRKSVAFRPRVIKQNRGSQGEGIWICKLKDEDSYCEKFGDKLADFDTPLLLTEANDNHVEEHTVGEFLEFCTNGRTATSGAWSSTSTGKYLEGGFEAGAMLVDQRFLPRIVEGEVRCLMVGPDLVELIHKKPKAGGLSATLQSGAVYTRYGPDAPEFANLVDNFKCDLPSIMASFGMDNQPLPLLWTADYIFGDKDVNGRDTFYVGEFNCSCVGISKQLHQAHIVAETAVGACFPEDPTEGEVVVEEIKKDIALWSTIGPSVVAAAAASAVVVIALLGRRKR